MVGTVPPAVSEAQTSGVGLDDLFGGLVGAVLAVLFTTVWSAITEARHRVWESAGLARLVLHEVEQNESAVDVSPHPALDMQRASAWSRNPPSAEAWIEARVRLAQLLAPDDFAVLAEHNQLLESLAGQLEAWKAVPDKHAAEEIAGRDPSWEKRTADVKSILRQYANPTWRQKNLGF